MLDFRLKIWTLSVFAGAFVSCSSGKVEDSSGQGPVPIATPAPVMTPSIAPAVCQASQQAIGANIVFLVDNSSSTNATDCPSPSAIGNVNGTPTYRCGAQTNREKAVLGAFDALTSVAVKDTRDLAISNIAVVQFPTQSSAEGSSVMTNGWVRTNTAQSDRPALESAMSFARTPFGASAFGSSIDAANRLIAGVPADGRGKVVVLITDGEPSDRDPADTKAKAAQLKALGAQVFTVYVTNGQTWSQRIGAHVQTLNSWEQAAMSRGLHWYAAHYANMTAYLTDLLGSTSQPSLGQSIATQADAACIDKPGALCKRFVVEASNSNALASIVQQIVTSKVTACP